MASAAPEGGWSEVAANYTRAADAAAGVPQEMVEEAAAAAKAAAAAADAAAAELRAVCAAARAMGTAPSSRRRRRRRPVGRVLHGASPRWPSAADDDAPAAAAAATAALAAAANARSAARAARENEAIVTDSPTATEDDEATVRQAVGYRARARRGTRGARRRRRARRWRAAADGTIHRAPQPLVNYDSVDPAVHKHMPAEEAPALSPKRSWLGRSLAVIARRRRGRPASGTSSSGKASSPTKPPASPPFRTSSPER